MHKLGPLVERCATISTITSGRRESHEVHLGNATSIGPSRHSAQSTLRFSQTIYHADGSMAASFARCQATNPRRTRRRADPTSSSPPLERPTGLQLHARRHEATRGRRISTRETNLQATTSRPSTRGIYGGIEGGIEAKPSNPRIVHDVRTDTWAALLIITPFRWQTIFFQPIGVEGTNWRVERGQWGKDTICIFRWSLYSAAATNLPTVQNEECPHGPQFRRFFIATQFLHERSDHSLKMTSIQHLKTPIFMSNHFEALGWSLFPAHF